jgi:hypothetical protein
MATVDLICSCGAELHVSGAETYVNSETKYFEDLHIRGAGHAYRTDPEPGEKIGRDNGLSWWKRPEHRVKEQG